MELIINQKRQPGYSDIPWLKRQAADKVTLDFIRQIEIDQNEFHEKGTPTSGDRLQRLNFKQGTFYTTRATAHSIAYVFVQIFKQKEHTRVRGFGPQKDQTVVDLGANEGFYSVYMARASGSRVIAVEANPIAKKLFSQNIRANNVQNITLIDAAVWTSKGVASFHMLPQVTSIGSLVVLGTSFLNRVPERTKSISVQTITLADIFRTHDLRKVDILKIDIEGTELDILAASKTELMYVDKIVVEYHSRSLRRALEDLLTGQGFMLVECIEDRPDFGDLYFTRLKK